MSIKQTVRLDEFHELKSLIAERQTALRELLDNKQNVLVVGVAPDLERFHDNTHDALAILDQLEVTRNNGVRVRISGGQQTRLTELSKALSQDASAIATIVRATSPETFQRSGVPSGPDNHDTTNAVVNPITAISDAMDLIASGLNPQKRRTPATV